ncbi:hypothetical protein BDY24DRAFT_400420 [Mrakia frigida]|uniref:uncharacterized protein n=1 Tax=Mrakia frigida TaxID=29902 RepID=UPI003FCC1773
MANVILPTTQVSTGPGAAGPSTSSSSTSFPPTTSSSSSRTPQAPRGEARQHAPRTTGDKDGSTPALSHSSSPSSSGSSPASEDDSNTPRFVQPASFYKSEHSVDADAFSGWIGGSIIGPRPRVWLSPEDDEEAQRGIPIFEPTMEEFSDFEGYMTKVDHWGRRSGIVKVIPPKEWVAALPPIDPASIAAIKIKNPIQQKMVGVTGLFRQNNVEKKKVLSVEDWFNKCTEKKFAAPILKEKDRSDRPVKNVKRQKKVVPVPAPSSTFPLTDATAQTVNVDAEMEGLNDQQPTASASTLPIEPFSSQPQSANASPSKAKASAAPPSPPSEFYTTLVDKKPWLQEGVTKEDYTVEACREVERKFWRGLGVGESAWYGADMQGTLFTDKTKDWNVGKLPNLLNRLKLKKQLPGVNTPYLYWGMWRSSFCWHVEDMDLYSVNYIHFGAPKCWYAIPQAKAENFERVMKGYFSADEHNCDQFLRHKSFAVSPMKLQNDALRPNVLVQHENEFVFTFPRGYHAGFNMDFNCAESINFAIDSWVELGRRARVCECIEDSVKIDVDAVLAEHELLTEIERQKVEKAAQALLPKPSPVSVPKKRKLIVGGGSTNGSPSPAPSPTPSGVPSKKIKLQARPTAPPPVAAPPPPPPPPVERSIEPPCVLCPSFDRSDLMPVVSVPVNVSLGNKDTTKVWMAHERCAANIPETYFVDVNVSDGRGGTYSIKMIEGVSGISKDRWNLGCSVCTKTSQKKMGGKIQCTKGKCLRAFHVTCALSHPDIQLHEIEFTETVTVKNSAGVVPFDQKVLRTSYKTECLCQTHNPVVKDRKRVEALEHRRTSLRALAPRQSIRIKSKNGQQYDVVCLFVDEARQEVTVQYEDGNSGKVPWSNVVLNPPPDHEPAVVMQHPYKSDYVYDGQTPLPRSRPPVASTSALQHPQHPPPQQQQQHHHQHQQQPSMHSYGQVQAPYGQQQSMPRFQHPTQQQNAFASSSSQLVPFPNNGAYQTNPSYYAPAPMSSYQPPPNGSYPGPPPQHQTSSSGPSPPNAYSSRPPPHPSQVNNYAYYQNPSSIYVHRPLPSPQPYNAQPYSQYSNPSYQPPSTGIPSTHPLPYPHPNQTQDPGSSSIPPHLQHLVMGYIPPSPYPFVHPNASNQATGPGGVQITPAMMEMMQKNPSARAAFESLGWKAEGEGQRGGSPSFTSQGGGGGQGSSTAGGGPASF